MKLKIGECYEISTYEVICVKKTKSGKYRMQTFGMTSGKWPGEGDISDYNENTKTFIAEFGNAISRFRLPTKEEMMTLPGVYPALVKAAKNYSSFGASNYKSWLGTANGSNNAYYVNSYGDVDYYSQSSSYVVAPAFNLDPSNVILGGKKIILHLAEEQE